MSRCTIERKRSKKTQTMCAHISNHALASVPERFRSGGTLPFSASKRKRSKQARAQQ